MSSNPSPSQAPAQLPGELVSIKRRSIFYALIVLISGMAIGAAGAVFVPRIAGCHGPGMQGGPGQQNGPRRPPDPEQIAERLKERLGLSQDEAAKFKTALAAQGQRFKAMRGEMQAKMEKEFESFKAEVKAALTPEHFQAWLDSMPKHHGQPGDRPPEGAPPGSRQPDSQQGNPPPPDDGRQPNEPKPTPDRN